MIGTSEIFGVSDDGRSLSKNDLRWQMHRIWCAGYRVASYRFHIITIIFCCFFLSGIQTTAAPCCDDSAPPAPSLMIPPTNDLEDEDAQSLRISRAGLHVKLPFESALPENYSDLWWRNLRRPSFCTMVLCHGGCAWRGSAENSACGLIPMFPILYPEGINAPSVCGAMP